MKHRVLILLSGCGNLDGSDPFESVFCHYWLEKNNCEVIYAAPSGYQFHSVDHLTGNEIPRTKRSIIRESARAARGKLFPLKELSPKLVDGVVIPGGQGLIKNFFTKFGSLNSKPKKEISAFLREHHQNKGVIAALSLAVPLISSVFKEYDFGFDLLNVKPGCCLVNSDLRFIVSPASISGSSLTALNKETENIIRELTILMDQKV